jgi:hypothetical protein
MELLLLDWISGAHLERPAGHGAATASFVVDPVGGPMAFAHLISPVGVQPDLSDGLPVAGVA